jgi:hypothetical protein
MFKSNNRYRDVIASPDGNVLYVLTDTAGNKDGTNNVFSQPVIAFLPPL